MSRLRFSRALKRSICIEYMQSGKSRKEIAMKYDLPSVNLLSAWIQSCLSPLEIHEKCASLQPVTVQMDCWLVPLKHTRGRVHSTGSQDGYLTGNVTTTPAHTQASA